MLLQECNPSRDVHLMTFFKEVNFDPTRKVVKVQKGSLTTALLSPQTHTWDCVAFVSGVGRFIGTLLILRDYFRISRLACVPARQRFACLEVELQEEMRLQSCKQEIMERLLPGRSRKFQDPPGGP